MRYLVHIDTPISLLHECSSQPEIMETPTDWIKTAEQTIAGERRNYYVSCPPWRILIVARNGLDIRRLNTGALKHVCYADCLVGWDDGQSGFVRDENKGRKHTKVTINTLYTLAPDAAQANARAAGVEIVEWSALLAKAPRSDQRVAIVARRDATAPTASRRPRSTCACRRA